jgi:hypothetical protein
MRSEGNPVIRTLHFEYVIMLRSFGGSKKPFSRRRIHIKIVTHGACNLF